MQTNEAAIIPDVDSLITLLSKYIEHVDEKEGIDFIDTVNYSMEDMVLTEKEINLIKSLRKTTA